MRIVGMRWRLLTVSLLSVLAAIGLRGDEGSSSVGATRIRASAPVEILASGFEGLSAVAVEASGAVLVTDHENGTLTRIDAAGRRHVLLDHLHGPTALAVESAGGVLIIDQGGTRLLRFSNGTVTTTASALRQARSVAVGPDGGVWLSMRDTVGRHDEPDDDHGSEYVIARLDDSGAVTRFAAGFKDIQAVAAGAGAVYVAMARLRSERGRVRTTLARIPVRADGSAGVLEPLLRDSRQRPRGLTVDVAGDLFVSGKANDDDDEADGRAGAIVKRHTHGGLSMFATGLRDPIALAFSPNGDLVAVERDHPGRVLRFRAPASPQLDLEAPAFTNQTPLALNGRAEAGARVAVARWTVSGPVLTFTVADATTGLFTLSVPLAPNAANGLTAIATGAGGAGLVGTPASVEIVHDDVPPSLTIIEPVSGVHTRGPIPSSAHAEDERSGVAALLWGLDGAAVAQLENPTPERPFAAATTVATDVVTEGPHAMNVIAADRAGNTTARSTLIVVDRTPPETLIVGGPAAHIAARTATFVVSGTDDWSEVGDLDYAWRLDERPWSAFDAAAVIEVNGLPVGLHRVEVRARDRAGNEDATPAVRTFTVTALQIRITEPAPGTVITTTSVWVRGTVESSAREVGVAVVLPPELRAELPMTTLAAATEAGTFAVEVPVTPSTTTLTATATDTDGAAASDQTTISVQPSSTSATTGFEASPRAGTAPHTVSFTVPVGETARVALDLEGDGSADYEGAALADQTFVYTRPGIYVATLRVTTLDGQVSAYRTAVEVYDRTALDARLQATWQGFKDALRSGDVARAVTFIHGDRRARWQEYFGQFSPGLFASTDTVFTDLALLEVAPDRAECEMMCEVDGLLYSFPISFLIDIDGRWRLWQF